MLSNECINDIKRLTIEARQEEHAEELFQRRSEIQEQALLWLSEKKLRKMLLDQCEFMKDEIREELEECTKEELVRQIIDRYDWSEQEFVDWLVNVYIDD